MLRSCATAAIIGLWLEAASAADPPRAKPPEFTPEERAAFPADPFALLVGPRPSGAAGPRGVQTADSPSADASDWGALIDAETLESEIKRLGRRLADATRSATAFKSGGFREASEALELTATWMAIIAEHPDSPRWSGEAAGLRDLFAAAGRTTGAATDAAATLAAERSEDLATLVRGGRPAAPDPQESLDWSLVATRSALMRRMEQAEAERLAGAVADERSLRRQADDVRYEAQVLAALAEVIVRPGADDAEDDDYRAYAAALREASRRLVAAAEEEDQVAAQREMTAVSRSCVDCHADYRG